MPTDVLTDVTDVTDLPEINPRQFHLLVDRTLGGELFMGLPYMLAVLPWQSFHSTPQ